MNKIWILSQQRTGSGYLCELLNNLNLFEGKFSEWFYVPKQKFINEKNFSLKDIVSCYPSYSKNLNSNYKKNLPDFCKIHLETMKCMFGNFENLKNFLGKDSKFIYLYRENILDQIASRYIAISTNKWRLANKKEKDIFLEKELEAINENTLKNCISYAIKMKKYNDFYIKKNIFLNIKYESLIEDEVSCVSNILSYLEIKSNNKIIKESVSASKKTILKQEHPKKLEILNFIKSNENFKKNMKKNWWI